MYGDYYEHEDRSEFQEPGGVLRCAELLGKIREFIHALPANSQTD